MSTAADGIGDRPSWFVGASYGQGTEDQTERFITEGVWVNGYKDRYLEEVKSIREGDRIAIKSSYNQKYGLPFETHGHLASVMAIKATGVVTENLRDGRHLRVDWTPVQPHRHWYFFTNQRTIWRVVPGTASTDALIAFAFEGVPQDIDFFRNLPYWRDRFGDIVHHSSPVSWPSFYEEFASKLLTYRDRRAELAELVQAGLTRLDSPLQLIDQHSDGTAAALADICPFTVLALFNRGTSDSGRREVAKVLADLLGVGAKVPTTLEDVPEVNPMKFWFFNFAKDRNSDDIDVLWDLFEAGLALADEESGSETTVDEFLTAFDVASERPGAGWRLTKGLHWARPWSYVSVDGKSKRYIREVLRLDVPDAVPRGEGSGELYLELLDKLAARFEEDGSPVHSPPELSQAAAHYRGSVPKEPISTGTYTLQDIVDEGSFIGIERLKHMLERLRDKKNIILQGPPGTGKTWLSKKLALALIGEKDDSRVRSFQFHPNLSYEDFVRGWRPTGDGKLTLMDGPLMNVIELAAANPRHKYVVVIEEINRGNPAQIFGEMLTLLEADKRSPFEALELTYSHRAGERVYVPDNLYVIGTMNVADRSLALVDFAFRRRFAFLDLEPTFGHPWRNWLAAKFEFGGSVLDLIEARINELNEEIASDVSLGLQYRIGHSYVTPRSGSRVEDGRVWFRQVVETEIGPLLDEYWFDAPQRAQAAKARLLLDF